MFCSAPQIVHRSRTHLYRILLIVVLKSAALTGFIDSRLHRIGLNISLRSLRGSILFLAFFRLALECKSQRFIILHKVLKFYMVRHELDSLENLRSEVLQKNELTANKLDAYLIETDDSNCKNEALDPDDRRDAFFHSEASEKPEDLLGASAPHIGCSDEIFGTKSTEDLEKKYPNSIGGDDVRKTGELSCMESEFFYLKFGGSSSYTGWTIRAHLSRRATNRGPRSLTFKVSRWKQGEGMLVFGDRLRSKANAWNQCSHKPLTNEKHEECVEEEVTNQERSPLLLCMR